jgi:hypothetical protein
VRSKHIAIIAPSRYHGFGYVKVRHWTIFNDIDQDLVVQDTQNGGEPVAFEARQIDGYSTAFDPITLTVFVDPNALFILFDPDALAVNCGE